MTNHINLPPPPVFFIKSISEQGYSLPTAVADLIDNSIAAQSTRVEILIDTSCRPLKLFIADNGNGMNAEQLTENMRFPSADLEDFRPPEDLGRFGLGLKTASFSQTRKFTVISKYKNTDAFYEGRTWDVDYLKKTEKWSLIIETIESNQAVLNDFENLSKSFHSADTNFKPNTLILWDRLYKMERLKLKNEINDELEELRNHLSLVFHRFISNRTLSIRLNNSMVSPFDPFPLDTSDVQTISENFWKSDNTFIKFEGVILPKRAAEESVLSGSVWNIAGKSLEELQGIYVYRNERLINYGGWLRSIPKSVFLQFGRVRVDISNLHDSLFHINVAKASLKIPFSLKKAMDELIHNVAKQASKEYRERIASSVIRSNVQSGGMKLISRDTTSNGPVLRINSEFELISQLKNDLDENGKTKLEIILKLLEKKLNEVCRGEPENNSIEVEIDDTDKNKIIKVKSYYEQSGYSPVEIKSWLIENYGNSSVKTEFVKSLFD